MTLNERLEAIEAMGQRGGNGRVIPILHKLLESKANQVRIAVAKSLDNLAMPDSGPSTVAGVASKASPMTPPRPVGSGQLPLLGRHAARPEASTGPSSQNDNRIHSRSHGRWVTMRQPQTATGSTSTVAARPNNCISRSAPIY